MKDYLEKSNALLGILGECYAKGYFQKHNYAYVSLEQIFKSKKYNEIEFEFGSNRILVDIPKELQKEIEQISTPKDIFKPYYIFDFLICEIQSNISKHLKALVIDEFHWVEVKSGNSPLSQNQIRAKSETKIPVKLCRVEGVYVNLPRDVGIDFSEL